MAENKDGKHLDDDCIFCKIIKGEIPSDKLFENDTCVVFNDINPHAPIHLLIVPKIHVKDIMEMDEEIVLGVHKTIKETVEKLSLYEKGFNILNNCGENAGQTVMHAHFHLLSGKRFGF